MASPSVTVHTKGYFLYHDRIYHDDPNYAFPPETGQVRRTTRVPAYTVVDLGLRWQATRRLSLDVRLDNALDEVYADNGWTTMWLLGRPRSVSVSTNVLF